ncbi:MAG: hypothetical protein CBC48_15255 [bacterium TMED88]|nr:hypothetical protein [Deltaproteobacteria bacterium]OUV26533.1 MAG: hypothetical protein CBC48_15255 [bacterium TMED88]
MDASLHPYRLEEPVRLSQNRPIWTLLAWAPAGLWALVIWQLGGDGWSAPTTSRFLGPLIEWLFPAFDPETQRTLAVSFRKLAHPTVYGILAGLAYPASLRTLRGQHGTAHALLTLAPILLLAVADEWRQSGSVARTGSGVDVLLDFAGATAAFWLAGFGERLVFQRRRKSSRPRGRI